MTDRREDGAPVASHHDDQSAAERRARRDVLIFVGIFGGVLLINGLLTLLMIALVEALGWWDSTALVESFMGPAPGRRWVAT
jgi:hypothetical protein